MYLLIKPASGACNLRCKYCFYADEMENREHTVRRMMTNESFDAILRKAVLHLENTHDDNILSLGFQGGEPMLAGLDFFKGAVASVRSVVPKHISVRFFIQTNGMLINDEWAEFFKENEFLVGVSMDGSGELHNKNRVDAGGKGTHRAVQRGMARLKSRGCDFNVLTVLTRENARSSGGTYCFFKSQGLFWQQYIPCIAPLGGDNTPWSLDAASYGEFLCRTFDLWYDDLMSGRAIYNREFENYIAILAGFPPEDCGMTGICSVQYLIESDGSVYPCDFYALDDYLLGNLLSGDSFEDIDRRRDEIGFISRSRLLPEECLSCRYLPLCRGGCYRNRDKNGKNRFCESCKMLFNHALPRMERLAQEVKRRQK